MLDLGSFAIAVAATIAATSATAFSPTTRPSGAGDLTPLLGSSPTALCNLGLEAQRLTTLLWRARISAKPVGLAGLRATVTSRSLVVDARGSRWTRRATPAAPWTWNGMQVRWYEESFVETADSQRALTGRLALAVPVDVVRATLARQGEDVPVAPGRREVDGRSAGYGLTVRPAGALSILECRSND